MYGDVVMGIPHNLFESKIDQLKREKGVVNDNELTAKDLRELVKQYKLVYETAGVQFPQDPLAQMKLAASPCLTPGTATARRSTCPLTKSRA